MAGHVLPRQLSTVGMEASAPETSSEAPKYLIVKDPFLGKNRLRKEESVASEEEDASPRLDPKLWSRLPEEVLLQIFARLPVKDILRIGSLNKTWRSSITSPHFQVAFEGASSVRIALMVHDKVDGTMFLTQDEGPECFRPGIARCPEVVSNTKVVATANGLVCVVEHEKKRGRYRPDMLEIRVFVMNVVTGFRRALPHPSEMPAIPSFARMDSTGPEGGYTITFIYVFDSSMSWEVYDSVENRWSKDELEGSATHVNGREVFNMHCMSSAFFYENVATFDTKAKTVSFFELCASHGDFCDGEYNAHSVHDVSGDLYNLCVREGGQHGVWKKLFGEETWELVCECPKLDGTWTCLRVMNDVVVLLFKLPYHCKPDAQLFGVLGLDVGTVLKVFHMPTKSWHNFPEKDYVVQNWGVSIRKDYAGPFLVEAKFDVVP